jgi:hypothetical protein
MARSHYREVKQGLDRDQQEFDEINRVVTERDGYTCALASALGEESNATEENAKLRRELADLTAQIEATQLEIDEYKSLQCVTFVAGLQRERAFYHAEIENLKLQVAQGLENIRTGKVQMGKIVRSDAYASAVELEARHVTLKKRFHQLRGEMDYVFRSFSESKPKVAPRNVAKEIDELVALFERKLTLTIEVDRLRHKKLYKEFWSRESAMSILDQIEQMNQIVVLLDGEKTEIDPIRTKFLLREVDRQEEGERRKKGAGKSKRN